MCGKQVMMLPDDVAEICDHLLKMQRVLAY
jgi:hypothetical protein